ncbi:sensor histidine kinase [Roseobacter sp. SK209-2-6]|uniref:sensor histidine kinase n=1 Tax=Roseobacter sp. SK209-2-6 TaxID=388739 RepID=UPI00056C7017|nr:HAMP domain-containing sensor histidine kinase [Roseobacter sp. SK209-2-6]
MSALRQTLAQSLCFLVLLSIGGFALESFLTRELQAEIDRDLRHQFSELEARLAEGKFSDLMLKQEDLFLQVEEGYGLITSTGELSGPLVSTVFNQAGLRTIFYEELFNKAVIQDYETAIDIIENSDDEDLLLSYELPFDGEFGEQWRVLSGPVAGGELIVFLPAFSSFALELQTVILIAVALLSVPALAVGVFFGWRAQKRLDRIASGYARIADGDLSVRMAPKIIRDDLDLLASRIDEATVRLQGSLRQMSEFSANIAHDLRTPLTRLQLHLDSGAHPDQAFLDSAIGQANRIVKIFDAIQRIARLRTRERRAKFKQVDLGEVAEQAMEIYSAVAEDADRHLTCRVIDPAVIDGDPELLLQMTANLVENAIRHCDAADSISIRVEGPLLSISDNGPGIPPDQREKVLEPMYRLDRSRTSNGSGLGLAMVKAITDLHDADLQLSESENGKGLCVSIRFTK